MIVYDEIYALGYNVIFDFLSFTLVSNSRDFYIFRRIVLRINRMIIKLDICNSLQK